MINKIPIKMYKNINNIESLDEANCIHNYLITIKFLTTNFHILNKFIIMNNFHDLQLSNNNGYLVDINIMNKFLKLYPDNYFQQITILLYPYNKIYLLHCYFTNCININSTIYQANIKNDILYINSFYNINDKTYITFKNYISSLHLLNCL